MQTGAASVIVAMSGGLDSSLAAALLKNRGWAVRGLHFRLPAAPDARRARERAVKRVAGCLGIPLDVLDLEDVFTRKVIDPFMDAYGKGITPNPCVRCNELVKFACLRAHAAEIGAEYLATGHYARLRRGREPDDVELWRGRDREKEQSYFLHRLDRSLLRNMLFPLGDMTKAAARRMARDMDLPVHDLPESREICFIPDNDYRGFMAARQAAGTRRPGEIVNTRGEALGRHDGTYRYTIGQRHGLGIASSRPYYVKEIRPETREIVVARKEDLFSDTVDAERFHWLVEAPPEARVAAQIRYRHRAAPGRMELLSADAVRFVFDAPQWAVTPGQALVCYDGDRVLGGGWIRKTAGKGDAR